MVPSPRLVPTYDQEPQMSAHGIVAAFQKAFAEQQPQPRLT